VEPDARLDIPSAGQRTYAESIEDGGVGHPKEILKSGFWARQHSQPS